MSVPRVRGRLLGAPMMAITLLWCTKCFVGYACQGELPAVCPQCEQATRWTTTQPYAVTENDATFLKSIRIRPERRVLPSTGS